MRGKFAILKNFAIINLVYIVKKGKKTPDQDIKSLTNVVKKGKKNGS